VAWRKRPARDPLTLLPAELDEFDPREWTGPGEDPSYEAWHVLGPGGSQQATDYWACRQRYSAALHGWFDAHPEASFLTWIRGKRARRLAG
jgi:hypothetical protein